MNSVAVYTRRNNNEDWQLIWRDPASTQAAPRKLGTGTLPANFSDLLDEALDNGYIDLRGVEIALIPPDTQVKVEITDTEDTYARYYIVGGDDATESPTGSGKWTHKLFLLEPTKKTEGVLCQSITFTNTRGATFASNTWVVS